MIWFVAIVAYLLAPFAALIKSIYVTTIMYSNKIITDVYPHRIQSMNTNGEPEIVKSKCCRAMVRAKFNEGKVEYFYCESCGTQIPKEDLNANN